MPPPVCPSGCGVWTWCPAHLWEPLGASCPRGVRVQDACCGPADRRLELGQGSPLGVSVSGMEKGASVIRGFGSDSQGTWGLWPVPKATFEWALT